MESLKIGKFAEKHNILSSEFWRSYGEVVGGVESPSATRGKETVGRCCREGVVLASRLVLKTPDEPGMV